MNFLLAISMGTTSNAPKILLIPRKEEIRTICRRNRHVGATTCIAMLQAIKIVFTSQTTSLTLPRAGLGKIHLLP